MAALDDLQNNLLQFPEKTDQLLEQYIQDRLSSKNGLEVINHQLENSRKLFAGMKNDLSEDDKLSPYLIAVENSLQQACLRFSQLKNRVDTLDNAKQ